METKEKFWTGPEAVPTGPEVPPTGPEGSEVTPTGPEACLAADLESWIFRKICWEEDIERLSRYVELQCKLRESDARVKAIRKESNAKIKMMKKAAKKIV